MKRLALASAFLGVLSAAGPGWASSNLCTTTEDLAAVAATRTLINQRCPCANAISDGLYKKCALTVANDEITALRLPRECRRVVVKCAAKSTCGRPIGYHPCCRTNRLGKTRCKITIPEKCQSGPGGSHCVSFDKQSCCDACKGNGVCSPSGAFVDVAQ
jgi:hypothetical protein